jgi:hypothetical protein
MLKVGDRVRHRALPEWSGVLTAVGPFERGRRRQALILIDCWTLPKAVLFHNLRRETVLDRLRTLLLGGGA